jgi:hypothetical protein
MPRMFRARTPFRDLDGLRRFPIMPAPGSPEGDNIARASWAAKSVVLFADTTGMGAEDELETIISDLVTDLKHLCDATNVSWHQVMRRANRHHIAEVRGEL